MSTPANLSDLRAIIARHIPPGDEHELIAAALATAFELGRAAGIEQARKSILAHLDLRRPTLTQAVAS